MKKKTLFGLLILITALGTWFYSPFKWRAELEFGIKLPNSASEIIGLNGPARTLTMMGLNTRRESGSVLKFSLNKVE